MVRVLVTDSDSRKALCAVRSLGKKGYEVYVACEKKFNISKFSKYANGYIYLPSPSLEADKYINLLVEKLTEYDIDVIIPMEDDTVELLTKNIELLKSTKTLIPDYETFILARNKALTIKAAIENNISVPETYFIQSLKQLNNLANDVNFPLIIKPRISSGSRGIVIVTNNNELIKKYKEIHKEYPYPIIQQYIEGDFEKVQVLAIFSQNNEVKGSCVYQGLREFPVDGGPVTLWKTISFPEIEEKTIAFLKNLKWKGFAEVEYIVNKKTNEYYLMEINPRFSANIALAVQLGIDFPVIFTELALGKQIEYMRNNKYDEYCQWLLPGDLLNFIFNKNRFDQEIGYLFNKPNKIYYAILSKEDIKPVVATFLSLILNIGSNMKDLIIKLRSGKSN